MRAEEGLAAGIPDPVVRKKSGDGLTIVAESSSPPVLVGSSCRPRSGTWPAVGIEEGVGLEADVVAEAPAPIPRPNCGTPAGGGIAGFSFDTELSVTVALTWIMCPHRRHFIRSVLPATLSSPIWYLALQFSQTNFIPSLESLSLDQSASEGTSLRCSLRSVVVSSLSARPITTTVERPD